MITVRLFQLLTIPFDEELFSRARNEWMAAMKDVDSITTNQVLELVDLLYDRKLVGNNWVLKVKPGLKDLLTNVRHVL